MTTSTDLVTATPANHTVTAIRGMFKNLLARVLTDSRYAEGGSPMLELTGVSFLADDDHIFGAPNLEYIARELQWYDGESLNVNDIPGGPPRIWQQVADEDGLINSNYGYLLYSDANGRQWDNVVEKLLDDPETRQAVAVYTRPSIHVDALHNGRHDFICTNTVQYLIREGKLDAVVNMRSNDAVFGYRNDYAWQRYVLNELAYRVGVAAGSITWQVGSLHVYPRHLRLVDQYATTGVHDSNV